MKDLAEWISRLMIELTKFQDEPSSGPQSMMSSLQHCYICERDGHGNRDCSEMKALVVAGTLKYNASSCLVMADGSKLP